MKKNSFNYLLQNGPYCDKLWSVFSPEKISQKQIIGVNHEKVCLLMSQILILSDIFLCD